MPGPTIREVASPLIDEDLAPLTPEHTTVQVQSRLTDDEFARLAEFLAGYPDVRFRVYGGYDGSIQDLEFLRYFPTLRHFAVDAIFELPSLDGIGLLPKHLESLVIGSTRSQRFSLTTLRRFRKLRTLYLEAQQKDIASIGELSDLRDLTLRSITLPDLSVLLPLQKLTSLDIKLGGTRELALLPRIGRLEYVELWMIKGLDDVDSLAEIPTLEAFKLQAIKRVTRLPSFARSHQLRGALLDTMKGISDLSPLSEAPALERLGLVAMCHLQPKAVIPFVGHPTLSRLRLGLCSHKKNSAAWDLLPIGDPPYGHPLYSHQSDSASG